MATTNKQLVKCNTHLTVSNFKASHSARRLTNKIQELEGFKELSAAATDELIAAKDADLQEERRLSLAKDERLKQTEQDLVAMRAALVHGATVAGTMYQASEANLQQSVPGHIGRTAVSKSERYISLNGLRGISRFSNGAQGDTRSRFIRDLKR